jgi:hypothetical protein
MLLTECCGWSWVLGQRKSLQSSAQKQQQQHPWHRYDRFGKCQTTCYMICYVFYMTCFGLCLQVHKARLADGRQVAVKVQYPGLRGAANADLTTLGCVSRCAQALFPEFRLGWLFDELQLKLTEELGECCNLVITVLSTVVDNAAFSMGLYGGVYQLGLAHLVMECVVCHQQ